MIFGYVFCVFLRKIHIYKMTYSIPTTHWAKKVLLSHFSVWNAKNYNTVTLQLDHFSDAQRDLFTSKRKVTPVEAQTALLLETVQIIDIQSLSSRLDRYAKQLFCEWITHKKQAQMPTFQAITLFYAAHQCDEWDWSQEAALKYFQRFEKKTPKYLYPAVQQNTNILVYDLASCEAWARAYEAQYPSIFRGRRFRDARSRRKLLRYWIGVKLCCQTAVTVSKWYGVTQQNVSAAVASFTSLLLRKNRPLPTPIALSLPQP